MVGQHTKKRIVLYFINYSDGFYLKFIAKHYSFCEKIIMYDNFSDDNSVLIAKKLGFEVRTFGQRGVLNDQHYIDVKNHCWKEQRGKGIDFVIVCDADEFIIPPNNTSSKIPVVNGYNMISESLPINDIFEIKTGSPSESYSKQAIFNPDAVQEINFVHGCHKNHMILGPGEKINTSDSAKLYHFRQIGGVERLIKRHSEYRKRMSEFNKKFNMGFHYNNSDEQRINEFNVLLNQAEVLL